MTRLVQTRDDCTSAMARRTVELDRIKVEHAQHQVALHHAGMALEYYQLLRADLASWVGALRELTQQQITPLQQALRELDQDMATSIVQGWRQQQDDVVEVLHKERMLAHVLGRQPESTCSMQQTKTEVDEFGRNVTSKHVLEREMRGRQRRRLAAELQQQQQQQRLRPEHAGPENGLDSDAFMSPGEQQQAGERRAALREALHVAMNELDDEYTDLSNLIRVFDKWARRYPEEYRQCFASMSLADLANVLVQVDLCSDYHPLHWLDDQRNKEKCFPWADALKAMATGDSKDEETPLYRVVDMILIPCVVELLDEGAYNILSSKQSRSLAAFLHQLTLLLPEDHPLVAKMKIRISEFVRETLLGISLPILRPDALTPDQATTEDVREAIEYASTGQLYRLEKVLTNLVKHWAVLDDVAEPILDFMSSKYLFLLSSLKRELAGPAFRAVWNHLQPTGWLDRPELFLVSAPIRAAASVYAPTTG